MLICAVLFTGCASTKLRKENEQLKLDVAVLEKDNNALRKSEDEAKRKMESYRRILKARRIMIEEAEKNAEGK